MTADQVRAYSSVLFERGGIPNHAEWWTRRDPGLDGVPRLLARNMPRVVMERAEHLSEIARP